MKILFSEKALYPPRGGSCLSALTLLEELAKKHDVHGLCKGDGDMSMEVEGIKMHHRKIPDIHLPNSWTKTYIENLFWEGVFRNFVIKNKPDLIMMHFNYAPTISKVAREFGIPYMIFIRDSNHFCPSGFRHKSYLECNKKCFICCQWKHRIQYPFWKKLLDEHEKTLNGASVILANCFYKKDVMKKLYGLESEVVYPFIRLENYKTGRDSEYVTLIKPMYHKGVDIFLEVAKRMEDVRFLAVGNTTRFYANRLAELKNVKHTLWEGDMRYVYSKTRILLIPSLGRETFVRVGPEAMVSGIPCIVGSGITETIDGGGIRVKDTLDIDEWIDAINKLNDKTVYKKLSGKAKKKAKMFDFKVQYKKFEKILRKL